MDGKGDPHMWMEVIKEIVVERRMCVDERNITKEMMEIKKKRIRRDEEQVI